MRDREQVVVEPELFLVLARVGRGQVAQELEAQLLVVAAEPQEVLELLRVDEDERIAGAAGVLLVLGILLAGLVDLEQPRSLDRSESVTDAGEVHQAVRAGLRMTGERRILSWSFIRPSSSASGRGGQPARYTSTGTTRSTPFTTV